ncbi:MAG: PAS domain-containing protein [Ardenticatenaceae bacterium]|nr:PAS domain-containing protein [Ardenticatenaceae bacterium]MCB9445750.1 PAS domain-containing protein [Ardenticatenaceae bacterium]
MSGQNIFYSTLLFLAAVISIVVAIIVWRRRFAPGGLALVAFMLGMACWSGTYALYWANLYPAGHFWLDATYVGVVAVVPAFFIFVLRFTHNDHWLSRPLLALLIIQPILTLIILWTDPWHGLFFAGLRDITASTIYTGGPWFWVNIIYAYSINLLGVLLLTKSLFASQALYRRQIGLVLLATLIPWIVNIAILVRLIPLPELDLTPLAFTLTGIILAYSLFQYRFLDVVPIARDKLIENMKDGVLVVDNQERVVDHNLALQKLLGLKTASLIGQKAAELFPIWPQLRVNPEEEDNIRQEIVMSGPPAQHLNVQLIRLRDRQQKEQGKLIILRDITTRKQLEQEREALISTLQETLGQVKTLSGLLPICANCKKIRDDTGYWHDVAVYIRDHSEAEFSHGICPDCMKSLYPELSEKRKK